jgi:hypothetical protein
MAAPGVPQTLSEYVQAVNIQVQGFLDQQMYPTPDQLVQFVTGTISTLKTKLTPPQIPRALEITSRHGWEFTHNCRADPGADYRLESFNVILNPSSSSFNTFSGVFLDYAEGACH